MHPTASAFSVGVHTLIDSPLYAGLIVAAIVSLVGWFLRPFVRPWRRFGWSVLYDEAINQGDPTPPQEDEPGKQQALTQNMWEIIYQGAGPEVSQYKVLNGSLLVMEMRNIGRLPIRESDFDDRQCFRLRFPDRKVVHYKVRDNAWYRDKVHDDRNEPPKPGADNFFNLPSLQLNHNEGFKLLVLLEAAAKPRPQAYAKPVIEGNIQGGKFVEYGRHRRRRYGIAAAAVLTLLGGGAYAGDQIANGALAPAPNCVSGDLTIAGSTAFAPVFNQVVTEYEQHCPGAHISITADGSVAGLQQLENGQAQIAMFDGLPAQAVDPQYRAEPVGDVIFAVVGNRSAQSTDSSYFTQGLSSSNIRSLFEYPGAYQRVLVGRSSVSGTRQEFVQEFLQGNDVTEDHAGPCPARPGPGSLCLEPTTMQLLSTVNDTPDSMGYAEADALPFFTGVAQIPIVSGKDSRPYEPTRDNVLAGDYSFLATEHLYTNGTPSGLAAAVMDFLSSSPVTTQLRATTSFIACADLAGTKRGGDCHGARP